MLCVYTLYVFIHIYTTEKRENSIKEESNSEKNSTNQICNSNSSSEGKINVSVDKDKVRILTYNIFMRPLPIHSFESDFKDDRIKLIFIKVKQLVQISLIINKK
ncbi:hypothetical protein BCR32DRAFT_250403 [Anaeromyces robustus]|uniref:Uncharacterized protein n=1 Tax=Anaeromyces robustus TaxID=1754192 RepID=A0A1Y1W355_9FUNG|nr:hypothetical protein BCR32DRAFT_250403 [Anaeromyces robustus]|eukprot:ORX67716.1 hypothetical protein BCR32DRAFT_250403 [Anaeromyces robustus]